MSSVPDHPADRELWRAVSPARAGRGGAAPGGCPSSIDLAGWLEGRLSEAHRDVIEDHLASCGECRVAMTDVQAWRAERDDARALVPPEAIESARSLVPAAIPAPAAMKASRAGRWFPAVRWGLAAAASLAVCVLGWQAGSRAAASERGGVRDLATEMTFGVVGLSDLSDIELAALVPAAEEVAP